jgi:hypothetical protein
MPIGYRNARIRWTGKMEEAMLEGLVKAIKKGFCADSSYKFNGWKITLNYIFTVT